MFKLAKIALVCTLLASTRAVLADDVYRCGKVYQDSPCAGGNSKPMNEKPFRPSITQHSSKIGSNKAATSQTTAGSGNKAHAKTKKMLSKSKPVAAPEQIETEVETTQNTSATSNAQTILSPPTITSPTAINTPATSDSSKPTSAEPIQKPAEKPNSEKPSTEKQVAGDDQGVCSSLNAGLKNIAEQKAKNGNSADLKQQQKNLESAKKSAGC
jgi:hypothetical protein